ncbi:MAG: hypothetical protein QY310_14985 [Candidatus Jettenia sp. CY-1]|nr:MAG: hypothetical protein QY310_14985 [Candidatus Jettenia sp. CY-1]
MMIQAGETEKESGVSKKGLKEQVRKKLQNTQELLVGVVVEDFGKVEKSANNLVAVCETVGWTEEKTKGKFETHDTEFHEIAQELATLARDKNLEGMQNKYTHMVMICIDCHQHIRDVEAPEKYPGGTQGGGGICAKKDSK